MNKDKLLLRQSAKVYGENFTDHYLEIYKIYLELADKNSERRQSANSFFLSINTAIIGALGYFQSVYSSKLSLGLYLLISVGGMLICYVWYRLVQSYKQINSVKFKIIHQIEQNLPIAPYDAEWEMLGRGEEPEKYLPFTHVEILVPWIFFGLHALVLVGAFLGIF